MGQKFSAEQFQDEVFQECHPWSAVCVSWIVKRASGHDDFKYAAAHTVYTTAAKKNLLMQDSNPFRAYNLSTTKIAVGDIIVKRRDGDSVTYEDIDDGKSHSTHGDIVVKIEGENAITIGGNVSNSVKETVVKLGHDGTISSVLYVAVIRRE